MNIAKQALSAWNAAARYVTRIAGQVTGLLTFDAAGGWKWDSGTSSMRARNAGDSADVGIKGGAVSGSSVTSSGNVSAGASSNIGWTSSTKISAPSDGVIEVKNNSEASRADLLVKAIEASGQVTVPDGGVLNPGLRLTSEAHGIYRVNATSWAFAVAGTAVGSIDTNGWWGKSYQDNDGTGYFGWYLRSRMKSSADGYIEITNNAGTAFNGLRFGGTTNSFPMWKRDTTALKARLADDSADAPVAAGAVTASGTVTVPDGTAAAPGLRTTTEAHGMYRESNIELGLASVGAKVLGLTSTAVKLLAAQTLQWNGRSQIASGADGYLTLLNSAGTDFTSLRFGGTTSSFPMLKRSTTHIQVRMADDSGYGSLDAQWIAASRFASLSDSEIAITWGSGSPEGVQTRKPGSLYLDYTNGEAYIKNTGTGNTGWKLITRAA